VTTVTAGRRRAFVDLQSGRLLVRELMSEASLGELESLAFVVMPDHLHWLVQLCSSGDLSRCIQRTKSRSARILNTAMGTKGRFWQPGFHDHALRKEEDLVDFARYVVANPLRAGLVSSVRHYPLWDAIWV
jgi:putative transposase